MRGHDFLADLNPQQRQAVTFGDGPLLVVAGAGSGKTKTLACRVAYLIANKTPPDRILLLTFTRRAAREMVSRAAQALGGDPGLASQVWGGTFHAIANRLLRVYGKALSLSPDFTILDQSDSEDMPRVGVIRGQRRHRADKHRHGVRIVTKTFQEVLGVFVQHGVVRDVLIHSFSCDSVGSSPSIRR